MLYSLTHRVLQRGSAGRTYPASTVLYRIPFDRTHLSCTPRAVIAAVLQEVLSLQSMILPKRLGLFHLTGGCSESLHAFRFFTVHTINRGTVHRPSSIKEKKNELDYHNRLV